MFSNNSFALRIIEKEVWKYLVITLLHISDLFNFDKIKYSRVRALPTFESAIATLDTNVVELA